MSYASSYFFKIKIVGKKETSEHFVGQRNALFLPLELNIIISSHALITYVWRPCGELLNSPKSSNDERSNMDMRSQPGCNGFPPFGKKSACPTREGKPRTPPSVWITSTNTASPSLKRSPAFKCLNRGYAGSRPVHRTMLCDYWRLQHTHNQTGINKTRQIRKCSIVGGTSLLRNWRINWLDDWVIGWLYNWL
jgi:hypothetical protein